MGDVLHKDDSEQIYCKFLEKFIDDVIAMIQERLKYVEYYVYDDIPNIERFLKLLREKGYRFEEYTRYCDDNDQKRILRIYSPC